MEIIKSLITENERKICLIVIDGLGGLPLNNKTELETAYTPNLDHLTSKSTLGLSIPIDLGITPGSGPAHLALFGYDPIKYQIGRGVLEALGVGLEVGPDDLCVRANFATIQNGIIIDRRAGRITTEKNQQLCEILSDRIKEINNTEIIIKAGKEHRFVVVFRGKNLSAQVTESDPQKENRPPYRIKPLTEQATKTAQIVNEFIDQVAQIINNEPHANYLLLRGFAQLPNLTPMSELYKIKPAAIATYPMYKGIARLVGMDILACQETWQDELDALHQHFSDYNFFYLHFKEVDMKGEDGDFAGKVKLIEQFDNLLLQIISLNFDVLAITSDHSTPALLKGHSWHPNPFLLYSPFGRPDYINKFSEKNCAQGSLGQFYQTQVMSLLLAHSLKLKKYGA